LRKFSDLSKLLVLLGFTCWLMACHPASPSTTNTKLTVMATTTQLADIASVMAGDRVTVIGLVPRNGDPHEFEPTPDSVKQVAHSAAVFINGVGLEGWLEELVKNAGGERPILTFQKTYPWARSTQPLPKVVTLTHIFG